MSLVSEALRKARRESAGRDGARRGMVIPTTVVVGPRKSGIRLSLLLVVSVIIAAFGGAIIAWWILGHRGSGRAPANTAVKGGSTVPEVSSMPRLEPTSPTGGEMSRPHLRTSPQQSGSSTAVSPVSPTPAHRMPLAFEAVINEQNAPPTTPIPPAITSSDQLAASTKTSQSGKLNVDPVGTSQPRVYVLDANLGHVKLHLDYIVYKPSAPFGQINGQDISPGSSIEGFLVEEIGADFVRLRDNKNIIILRTK